MNAPVLLVSMAERFEELTFATKVAATVVYAMVWTAIYIIS